MMHCPHCFTPRFRTSRLRLRDLPHLAFLQFPVRCGVCRERFYVGIALALHLFQIRKIHAAEKEELRRDRYKLRKKTEYPV
jgi:hypothetical protein